MGRFTQEELDRFNSKWNKVGECHIWIKPLDKDGYGSFYFKKKNRRSHRVSYYLFVGDIPKGLVIDHICGHKNCVNPSHLRAITVYENNMDSRSIPAINARKTHCPQGHPYDKKYGKQRYCSICENEKRKRLHKKWAKEANSIAC